MGYVGLEIGTFWAFRVVYSQWQQSISVEVDCLSAKEGLRNQTICCHWLDIMWTSQEFPISGLSMLCVWLLQPFVCVTVSHVYTHNSLCSTVCHYTHTYILYISLSPSGHVTVTCSVPMRGLPRSAAVCRRGRVRGHWGSASTFMTPPPVVAMAPWATSATPL